MKDHEVEIGPDGARCLGEREGLALAGQDKAAPLIPGDPDRPAADGWPVRLGDLLLEAVRRNRRLRVSVLSWDFAVVFALDREVLPLYRLPWKSHRRLRMVLDADHPPAASHHQKVVVVDDRVAYCGGIDVTTSRWDTREHPADPSSRLNPRGSAKVSSTRATSLMRTG